MMRIILKTRRSEEYMYLNILHAALADAFSDPVMMIVTIY
jgi:hypothetical protein